MSCLKAVEEEDKMTPEQLAIKNVGKQVKRVNKYFNKSVKTAWITL